MKCERKRSRFSFFSSYKTRVPRYDYVKHRCVFKNLCPRAEVRNITYNRIYHYLRHTRQIMVLHQLQAGHAKLVHTISVAVFFCRLIKLLL